jgi:hypothetical protein
VPPIEGDDGTTLSDCECKDSSIRDALVALACLSTRQDVVAHLAEPLYDGEAEVLVGIEMGHRSCSLVVVNCLLDLRRMRLVVFPRGVEVILIEIGMVAENFRVAEAKPAPLH